MSEEQETNETKTSIPIKTWLSALWMILAGIIGVFVAAGWLLVTIWGAEASISGPLYFSNPVWIFIWLTPAVLPIISGIFIYMGKQWAWVLSVTILSIENLFVLTLYLYWLITDQHGYAGLYSKIYIPILVSTLIPLILIILDRKNYFEMMCQRELEKK